MSTQGEHGTQAHWLHRAFTSALGGLMFAALLCAGLVALQAARVQPLRWLEQAGIDTGMWLVANVGWFQANPAGLPALRYAFVDVDRSACEAFVDGEPASACATGNPARSALVVDLVRALRAAGAAVVVVDVAPPATVRERAAWMGELAGTGGGTGAWVIAPVFARPSDVCADGLSIHGDRSHDIAPAHVAGRLRLASVATRLDPEVADGVLRHYPMASRLHLDGEASRWLPTVPMLAAVLARGTGAAEVDALWYGPALPPGPPECGASPAVAPPASPPRPVPSDNRFGAALGNTATPAVVRFFFSLPGLSTLDETARRRVEQRHAAVYERYEAGRLLEAGCTHRLDAQAEPRPGCFGVRRDLFEGKVVVVGASTATALDRVQTPVGPMSGAEVLVNAIRAFAEFPAQRAPDGWDLLGRKLLNLLLPAGIALLAWIPIYLLCDRLRAREAVSAGQGRHAQRRLLAFGRGLLAAVLFLCGMAVAAWVELRGLVSELSHAATNAEPVDMLLPIVAMGLEGYAEAAKSIDALLHRPAAALVGLLAGPLLAARAAVSARWPGKRHAAAPAPRSDAAPHVPRYSSPPEPAPRTPSARRRRRSKAKLP